MDAIVGALGRSGAMNVDELRRGIESMEPAAYDAASYYERWLFADGDDPDREGHARVWRAGRAAEP